MARGSDPVIVRRRSSASIALWAVMISALVLGSVLVAVPGAARAESDADPAPVPQTPILSARRFPGALQAGSDAELRTAIDAYLARTVGSECVIVEQDGRLIYTRDADDAMTPASLMKLVTATAALEILGRDRTLDTLVLGPKPSKDGVVAGDLVIVGGGNPIITTKGYTATFEDADQVIEDLGILADRIVDAGITRIEGSIVGDDSRYESLRDLDGWPERYVQGGAVAPLSALVVNDGSTGYVDAPDQPNANRRAGDPPLLFAQTLTTVLEARGIEVTGTATTGTAPDGLTEIVVSPSLPMIDLVNEMLTYSDNTTAELLVREIGLVATGSGSTASGLSAIRQSLVDQGFDVSSLVQHDGSGLDPDDEMSCSLALALVAHLDSDSDVGSSLPVGGRNGTLKRRMLGSASTGRVRAKTGTLNGVNTLAGFADTPQGNQLTFAFLHNGNDTRTTGVADGFTDRLMTYAKGPRIASISPLPIR